MADRTAYRRRRRAEGKETWASLTPEQRRRARARSCASWATYFGKLPPQPCEKCGATEKVERHHDDYSKPLEVVWLCPPCHREVEAMKRKAYAMSNVELAELGQIAYRCENGHYHDGIKETGPVPEDITIRG